MSSPKLKKSEQPTLAGYDSETLGSTQEGVPWTYFAGRQKVAGKPISPVYNLTWKYAEDDRPGKK